MHCETCLHWQSDEGNQKIAYFTFHSSLQANAHWCTSAEQYRARWRWIPHGRDLDDPDAASRRHRPKVWLCRDYEKSKADKEGL